MHWVRLIAAAPAVLTALAFIFAGAGCASTDKVDVAIKPTTPLIRSDLLRLSRREYQDCVNAFYQDDWERLKLHAQQLSGLSQRWKDQRVRPADEAALREQSATLAAAVVDLGAAAEKKDVLLVTVALRRVPPCLAALEKLPSLTEAQPPKPTSP